MEREIGTPSVELTFKEIVQKLGQLKRYLLSYWKLVFLAVILGSSLGLLYAYFDKPIYSAKCTFVLEEEGSAGGLGQYAGLASMVGINVGGGSATGIFSGENILELYKSRLMIEKTLLSKVLVEGQPVLLVDRYIEINNLRHRWSKKTSLAGIQFSIPKEKFTLEHDSIIGVIVKDINKNYLLVEKPDKKLSIIQVEVSTSDQIFSKAFAEKIVENVNQFYIQTKTKKSLENVQLLQKQADSVKRVLNASIGSSASALDANPNANPALRILTVPSQRRQVDVQANSAIYSEVVKNLEISRISLRKETPLIQIIDRPVLPLEKTEVGSFSGMIIGGIVLGLGMIIYLILKRTYSLYIN